MFLVGGGGDIYKSPEVGNSSGYSKSIEQLVAEGL